MADQNQNININVNAVGADTAEAKLNKVNAAAQKLDGSGADASKSIANLGNDLKGLGGGADSAAQSVVSLASGFGVAVAGVALLATAVVSATIALEANAVAMQLAADDAAEFADKLGVTTTQLQILKLIADENGGSVEGLQRVYDKLGKSLTKMDDDNEKTINSFRALGIEQKELANLTQTEIAGKLVDAWEASGRSVQTTAALMQLLGPSFREQIPAIKAAADNMGDYAERVKQYGGVASAALVEMGGKQEVAMGNLGMATTDLKNAFAEGFGDMSLTITNWSANVTKSIADAIRSFFELRKGVSFLEQMIINAKAMAEAGFDPSGEKFKAANARMLGEASRAATVGGGRGSVNPDLVTPNAPFKALAPIGGNGSKGGSASAKEDPFEKMLRDMQKRSDLVGKTTELEKIQWENANGASKKFTESQKMQLENVAKMYDTKTDQLELDKLIAKILADDVKNQEKKTKELDKQLAAEEKIAKRGIADLAKSGSSAVSAMNFAKRTTGMGATDKELFKGIDDNAAIAEGAIAGLNDQMSNYLGLVADIRAAEKKSNEDLRTAAEDKKAYAADWTNGAKNAIGSYLDYVNDAASKTEQAFTKSFKAMEDGIVDFAMTGKFSFSDMASSIIKDMIRMIVQKNIMGPLMGGISSFFGFADGGAFSGGNVVPFADGGVVTGPTMFGMSGGRTGLMGEAGPEAIMPLKRGADGSLGVKVSGGGSNGGVNVGQINIKVEGGKTNDETGNAVHAATLKAMRDLVKSEIITQQRLGGSLNRI